MLPISLLPQDNDTIKVLDQRLLPHVTRYETLRTWQDCHKAIADMWVRGAPLIGITAAYGVAFAARDAQGMDAFEENIQTLATARPTAVNLAWAIAQQRAIMKSENPQEAAEALWQNAQLMRDADAEACRMIGVHGLPLIEKIYQEKQETVQILTHCNAGALACIDWGTATSPIYWAHQQGIPVHVWVDETRPRNQGAHLTAWELREANVPHTVITDNAGGHLMQQGKVDIVITGADRVAANGDAANKIGTYLKALAARANDIPFYIALPQSTFDPQIQNGLADIPIEARDAKEVTHIQGWDEKAEKLTQLRLTPEGSTAFNPGFDVTPASLITGYITDQGQCLTQDWPSFSQTHLRTR